MKFSNLLLIAVALYTLAKNKLSEWADKITVTLNGKPAVSFKNAKLTIAPPLEFVNPTPAAITVNSSTTTVKYNGKILAKSVDLTPFNIAANSRITFSPQVVVSAFGTYSAIIDAVNATGGTWSYSGTLYTATGAIPWSYTETTTAVSGYYVNKYVK